MTGIFHIVLARKPLEGTIAENCLQWGCGALWIEGCRVGWDTKSLALDQARRKTPRTNITGGSFHSGGGKNSDYEGETSSPSGRFPANLILGHCEGCLRKGTKKIKGHKGCPDGAKGWGFHGGIGGRQSDGTRDGEAIPGHADAEGKETIEEWQCKKDCAVGIIGEQSGVKTSDKSKKVHEEYGDAFKFGGGLSTPENQYGDTGTAARFFFNYSEQESDDE